MTTITCAVGTWVEIATGVTSTSFNLKNNFPDPVSKCGYKIHWGASAPAVDTTDFLYYELDGSKEGKVYSLPVQFSNSTATSVYVMSVYSDGSVVY